MTSPRQLAVIDLGSNSFRLVVFAASSDWWKRVDEIYEPVRIGEGLAASGSLGEQPMRRALRALGVFAHFCRTNGLSGDAVDPVATSAIREASNSSEFLARAREQTGLEVRVLSQEQEARYGYIAAVNSTTLSDGCVLDLGGGSVQLVRVENRRLRDGGSWPLGAVRMTERFLAGKGPAKPRQLDALRAHVAEQLEGSAWLSSSSGKRLVGMGGSVRGLAAAAQRTKGTTASGVQGAVVERETLDDLVLRLAALPASERSRVPGIKPVRADLILAAAVVVQAILEIGSFDAVETTEAGLREGIFFEYYLDGDPPLLEDVRRSSVRNLAARYDIDPAHTEHVTELALSMFDQLARLGLHPGDQRERELLWAACELHDIGMSIDYDQHHKHSRYLILSGGLPGFSPAELAIISQAARYHRKGMPTAGPMQQSLGPADIRVLDRCAALLRLAEDLERSRDQLVREALFSSSDGEVQLRLVSDGPARVACWAASRERELFARAFERELAVVS